MSRQEHKDAHRAIQPDIVRELSLFTGARGLKLPRHVSTSIAKRMTGNIISLIRDDKWNRKEKQRVLNNMFEGVFRITLNHHKEYSLPNPLKVQIKSRVLPYLVKNWEIIEEKGKKCLTTT